MLYSILVFKGTTVLYEDEIDTEVQAITFAKRVIVEGIRIREGKTQIFYPPHVISKVEIWEA